MKFLKIFFHKVRRKIAIFEDLHCIFTQVSKRCLTNHLKGNCLKQHTLLLSSLCYQQNDSSCLTLPSLCIWSQLCISQSTILTTNCSWMDSSVLSSIHCLIFQKATQGFWHSNDWVPMEVSRSTHEAQTQNQWHCHFHCILLANGSCKATFKRQRNKLLSWMKRQPSAFAKGLSTRKSEE